MTLLVSWQGSLSLKAHIAKAHEISSTEIPNDQFEGVQRGGVGYVRLVADDLARSCDELARSGHCKRRGIQRFSNEAI